jgi:hypothetical protein
MNEERTRHTEVNADLGQIFRFLRGARAAFQPEVEGGFGGRLEAFMEPQRVEATERQNRLRQQFAPEIEALNAAMQEDEAAPQAGLDSMVQGRDPRRVSRLGIRLAARLAASGARPEDIRALTGNALAFGTQASALAPDANTPEGAARTLGAATAMDPTQAYKNVPAMARSQEGYAGAERNIAHAGLYGTQQGRVETLTPFEQQTLQAQAAQAQAAAGLSNVKAAAGGFAPHRAGQAGGPEQPVGQKEVNSAIAAFQKTIGTDLMLEPDDVEVQLGILNDVLAKANKPPVTVEKIPGKALRMRWAVAPAGGQQEPPPQPPPEQGSGLTGWLSDTFNPQGQALAAHRAVVGRRGEAIANVGRSVGNSIASLVSGPGPATAIPPPMSEPQRTPVSTATQQQPPPRSWTPTPGPATPPPTPPMQPTPQPTPAIPKLPPEIHNRLIRNEDVDAREILAAYMAMGMPEAEAKAAVEALAATLGR